MQYPVQMRLSTAGRPTTFEDGVLFIEQFVPPLAMDSRAGAPASTS